MSKLMCIAGISTLLFGSLAMLPFPSAATAADVEIGRDGVEVDAGDDRHHHHEDEHIDEPYHDRYHHDRDDDGVNIDVPGADIHVD
ncbi:MAG: hypothetical protein ACPW61_00305 [Methyloligella sp. ZOD6]